MEEVKNNDELYAKIETEKLIKEKKKKNIFTIVFLAMVFVLAVVIICLASIPLNLKPSFLKDENNIRIVEIRVNETSTSIFNDDTREFSEFNKVLNDAFGQTYFSALFNGSLGSVKIVEGDENGDYLEATDFVSDLNSYVKFNLINKKSIIVNGKEYSSKKQIKAIPFTFTEVYLTLDDEGGIADASFYAIVEYVDAEGNSLKDGEYVVEIRTKGDTSKIVEHYTDEE